VRVLYLPSFFVVSFNCNARKLTQNYTHFYRKDATLREILTTLRSSAPKTPEYRHPLARYSFRSIYFDPHSASRQNRDSRSSGSYSSKELGIVYSRDILGDPGSVASGIARRLMQDEEPEGSSDGQKTLEDLKFVPGDLLSIAVLLPKNVSVTVGPTGDVGVKGTPTEFTTSGPANGWKSGSGPGRDKDRDAGWSGQPGRGSGGHWRGESNGPSPAFGARGRGGGLGRGRDRDREKDREDDYRRVPPPRRDRDSPPPRRGARGGWDRGGGRRRSRDSRSRSPPRRNPRYD
jgi:histone deacetylase complex subunit SAP18